MGSPTTGGSEVWESGSEPHSSSSSVERGRLLVISGPSGAGKSTIVHGLLAARDLAFSVSATTREPRPGEVDGQHYHFMDTQRFRDLVDSRAFLEWAEYGSNLYGTPLAPVLDHLDRGCDVVLEIEMQGARQVKEIHPEALFVFIAPPSIEILERRLRDRGDTSPADVERRLEIARHELVEAESLFDHVIVNEDVDEAVAELVEILDQERGRASTGEDDRNR